MHRRPSPLPSASSFRPRNAIFSIAISVLLTGAFGILNAQTPAASGASTQRRGEPVTLNFNNAEIESIARTMGVITGRNVVVDPRVKGTMSLTTESPVPPARALGLFEAQLRMQGFAVVESAGLYKVVPEADAAAMILALAAGEVSEQSLARWIRDNWPK